MASLSTNRLAFKMKEREKRSNAPNARENFRLDKNKTKKFSIIFPSHVFFGRKFLWLDYLNTNNIRSYIKSASLKKFQVTFWNSHQDYADAWREMCCGILFRQRSCFVKWMHINAILLLEHCRRSSYFRWGHRIRSYWLFVSTFLPDCSGLRFTILWNMRQSRWQSCMHDNRMDSSCG